MSQTMTKEEQKISQEVNDRISQNPAYLKTLLAKTEQFSANLYEKSPMKSEFLETKAKYIEQKFMPLLDLLDTNIDKSLQMYNTKMTSFQQQYQTQKNQISDKLNNSTVVQKSNQYQYRLVSTLETHLNQVGTYFLKKDMASSPTSEIKEGENGQTIALKDILQRYKQLIENANIITFEVYAMYFQLLQKTAVYGKLQEVKIFQEVLFDVLNENIVTPVNTMYVQPQVQRALVFKTQSLEFYNKQQKMFVELMQRLLNEAIENYKKGTIIVTIKNSRKQVDLLVNQMKDQYTVLRGAVIKVYKEKITIEFAKQFYAQNQAKIIEALKQMQQSIKETKTMVVDNSKQVVSKSKQVYNNALEEFKRRKEQHAKKSIDEAKI